MWPLIEVDDLVGATFLPSDGQASPSDIAQSLAKGARMHGAQLFEGVACHRLRHRGRPRRRRRDRPRPDRLRQGRDLRRHVGAAGRRHGRRQRPAAAGQASICHHREDRRRRRRRSRPSAIPTGAPISRRRSAGSSSAATSRTRSPGRPAMCPRISSSSCSTTTGIISSSIWSQALARDSGACHRRHQADDQRAGIASRPTAISSSAKPPKCKELLRRRRLQRLRHRLGRRGRLGARASG